VGEVVLNAPSDLAEEIDSYLAALFPIHRSLGGDGNRETLRVLSEIAPIEIVEYPCGSEVFDWVIPPEWKLRDAWIKTAAGEKVVDCRDSNLHLVNYSESVRTKMTFDELAPRLHYLEGDSSAIPYRTSYYNRTWGFCVSKSQFRDMKESGGTFDVCIDADFDPDGSMSIGELKVAGRRQDEFLVSTYICHPSMANDNLSGMVATALLARSMLLKGTPEYSWRYIFVPETIGALAYLRFNESAMKAMNGGFVVTCCGGPGALGMKETYLGDHLIDRAIRLAFRDFGVKPVIYPFRPDGSDERQYSSPGFRIPVATVTKDKYYEYSEYHTSLDDLELVNGAQLSESLAVYEDAINTVESNLVVLSKYPKGEVQLGSRGLYPTVGGGIHQKISGVNQKLNQEELVDLISWIMFMADGTCDLVSISEQSGHDFKSVKACVDVLLDHDLVEVFPMEQIHKA